MDRRNDTGNPDLSKYIWQVSKVLWWTFYNTNRYLNISTFQYYLNCLLTYLLWKMFYIRKEGQCPSLNPSLPPFLWQSQRLCATPRRALVEWTQSHYQWQSIKHLNAKFWMLDAATQRAIEDRWPETDRPVWAREGRFMVMNFWMITFNVEYQSPLISAKRATGMARYYVSFHLDKPGW